MIQNIHNSKDWSGRGRAGAGRCGGFNMILEMLVALGMAALVLVGFSTAARGSRQLQDRLTDQSQAIVLLQNVLERMEADPNPRQNPEQNPERTSLAGILADEFAKSSLAGRPGFQAVCDESRGRLHVRVLGGKNRVLARMELKP